VISLRDIFTDGRAPVGDVPVRIAGPAERFADILTWRDIERILQGACFDGPGSAAIRQALGFDSGPSRVCIITAGREIWRAPRAVDEAEFLRRLPGSTLRIEAIEEVHAPLRTLADELQSAAPAAYLNAYAAFGAERGLGLHFDYTDIIVLQLQGEKHWSIYRPTRPAIRSPESAAYKDALQRAQRGESADQSELERVYEGLYWQGVLEAGDALFLPAGWFHDVRPLGGPTLHLSCAMGAPPGGGARPRTTLPQALLAAGCAPPS
jgi:hypothetical protein